ncbi:MAG TPA: hypothetical protein VJ842_14120 [Pyrinomonadaceae bacterium]|nr:hypothetical protein [Pyrinomonadaceae bacterium]
MKQINITRDSSGNVTFQTVSIDTSENVFFANQDPKEAHWPDIATNQIGAAPSANSSQCTVTTPSSLLPPKNQVPYTCKLHSNEKGIINVFAPLAAATTKLAKATKGTAITKQQVVKGGMTPYKLGGQLFQILDPNGNVIQSGSGNIGPGLTLTATTDNTGVWVSGTPTVSGTYQFTFTVDDGMGKNLQQVQYSMEVA